MGTTYRLVIHAGAERIRISGPAAVFEVLRPAGMRPVFIHGAEGSGWTLDRYKRGADRLPDVVAALEAAGHSVRLVEVAR